MSDIVIDREHRLGPYSDPKRYFAEIDRAIAAMIERGPLVKHASHDQDTHGNWADEMPAVSAMAVISQSMHDWRAWGKKWSDADKWVVDRYQGGAGGVVNGSLRGIKQNKDDLSYLNRYGRSQTPKEAVAQLDALIASAPPLPADAHVYRLLTRWPQESDADNVPASVMSVLETSGTMFTDKAFVSTTADMGFIERVIHSDTGGGINRRIMEIHVPKGTRVAYLPVGGNKAFDAEQEILLPRGGTFTVRQVLPGARTVLDYEPPKEYVA